MSTRRSRWPEGLRLVGDIEGGDDLTVAGDIDGAIHIDGDLLVDVAARVRGNVRARTVTVRGTIVGDIDCTDSVRVEEDARVLGDLTAPRVHVVRGARFKGNVHMLEDDGKQLVMIPRRPDSGAAEELHEPVPRRRPPAPQMPVIRRAQASRRGMANAEP